MHIKSRLTFTFQTDLKGGKGGGYDGNRGGRQGGAPSPNPPKKKHEENEERLKLLIVRIGIWFSTSIIHI